MPAKAGAPYVVADGVARPNRMRYLTGDALRQEPGTLITRRQALVYFSSVGAAIYLGCNGRDSIAADDTSGCVITPEITEGPFFIDKTLNRSNIVAGQPGVPLKLNVKVYNAKAPKCPPLPRAQIDIWHTNALGIYSDIPGLDSSGKHFLRGYQTTKENGSASFVTIYPGWYRGRTAHIHLKVRTFHPSGTETMEATTQLFFDDGITDAVYAANAPYNTRRARDSRNSDDGIYGERSSLILSLTGSPASGYTGNISIGVAV